MSAALKELHRLPRHKTAEGVAERKWREDEEPIGGDSEQDVDPLAPEIGAQLQAVTSACHRDRIGTLIIVLPCILGTGNRIAERCIAADDQIRDALVQTESGLITEAQAAAGRMVGGLIFHKDIAQERQAKRMDRLCGGKEDVGESNRIGDDIVGHREPWNGRPCGRQRIERIQARRRVTQEELIPGAEIMIEAKAALIVVVISDLG